MKIAQAVAAVALAMPVVTSPQAQTQVDDDLLYETVVTIVMGARQQSSTASTISPFADAPLNAR
jgi:hypothetical protein